MSPLLQPPRKILYLGIDPPPGVVHYPVIRTEKIESLDLETAIKLSDQMTHFIFTSKNAVRYWPGSIQGRNAIAIGEATARAIREKGGCPILAPDATQEGVIALLESLAIQDGYFLYPRSKRARMDLTSYLIEKNVAHFAFDLYDTLFQKLEPVPELNEFDEIVFTSPSTVEGFCRIFPSVPDCITLTPIGPITKRALVDLFFRMYDRVQFLSEETKNHDS